MSKRKVEILYTFILGDYWYLLLATPITVIREQDQEAIISSILGLVYVILTLPSIIYQISGQLPHVSNRVYHFSEYLVTIFEYLTVVSNPLVYTFLSPRFRKNFYLFNMARARSSAKSSRNNSTKTQGSAKFPFSGSLTEKTFSKTTITKLEVPSPPSAPSPKTTTVILHHPAPVVANMKSDDAVLPSVDVDNDSNLEVPVTTTRAVHSEPPVTTTRAAHSQPYFGLRLDPRILRDVRSEPGIASTLAFITENWWFENPVKVDD